MSDASLFRECRTCRYGNVTARVSCETMAQTAQVYASRIAKLSHLWIQKGGRFYGLSRWHNLRLTARAFVEPEMLRVEFMISKNRFCFNCICIKAVWKNVLKKIAIIDGGDLVGSGFHADISMHFRHSSFRELIPLCPYRQARLATTRHLWKKIKVTKKSLKFVCINAVHHLVHLFQTNKKSKFHFLIQKGFI